MLFRPNSCSLSTLDLLLLLSCLFIYQYITWSRADALRRIYAVVFLGLSEINDCQLIIVWLVDKASQSTDNE